MSSYVLEILAECHDRSGFSSGLESVDRCTPEYDLRFSRYFGTSPGFWLRLQLDYELMRAERENGERIEREVQPHAAGDSMKDKLFKQLAASLKEGGAILRGKKKAQTGRLRAGARSADARRVSGRWRDR